MRRIIRRDGAVRRRTGRRKEANKSQKSDKKERGGWVETRGRREEVTEKRTDR